MQATLSRGPNNSVRNEKLSGFTPHLTVGARMYSLRSMKCGGTSHDSPGSRLKACSNLSFLLVIIGPTIFPAFHTLPVFRLVAASFSLLRKFSSSYTERSTNSSEQAEHFCPALPKAEVTMFMMAWSRSPDAVRIITFLPPVSADNGVVGLAFAIFCAVSVPPVRMMCLMAGAVVSTFSASRRVMMTCSASFGTPASQNALANIHATGAATVAGFSITVFPPASPATIPPTGMAQGKFHGEMTSMVPFGFISTSSSAANFFIAVV